MFSGAEAGPRKVCELLTRHRKGRRYSASSVSSLVPASSARDQHLGWQEHAAPERPSEERVLETLPRRKGSAGQEPPVWPNQRVSSRD